MIHDVVLPWPNINLSIDLDIREVINDTIIFNVTVDDIDLSDYKIRCELCDLSNSLQYGNLAASGRGAEITELDADSGMSAFQVVIPKNATENFLKYGTLEIEIENTSGQAFTILQQRITFLAEHIDWNIPS